MELTFDQAAELLDEMAEQFPPVFFDELNGGILLEEEAKCDPMFPEGEVYFMGEYIQDGYLGNSIPGPRADPSRRAPGQRPRAGRQGRGTALAAHAGVCRRQLRGFLSFFVHQKVT